MRSITWQAATVAVLLLAAGSATAGGGVPLRQAHDKAGYTDTPVLPGTKWHVHDPARPDPLFVEPAEGCPPLAPARPPSDAIVLFGGKDTSKWQTLDGKAPGWTVRDGSLIVPPHDTPNGGDIRTTEAFGDCQLHVEWMLPEREPGDEHSMNRGNSGVYLQGLYEVQIFDCYRYAWMYADGQTAAIYGQYPPRANVCRKPGEWQSFDILFEAPRVRDGKVAAPAYLTVFHNGVCVHHHQPLLGPTGHRIAPAYPPNTPETGPILLQAHGSAVRFRNVWIRPLRVAE